MNKIILTLVAYVFGDWLLYQMAREKAESKKEPQQHS